jgi:hypothetical protein
LLKRHQTGDTDSVQPVILLPVQRDSQETFIPCEARMLWYSADRTSSQQLRDTTNKWVALVDHKVVASGNTLQEVKEAVERKKVKKYVFHLVPPPILLAP